MTEEDRIDLSRLLYSQSQQIAQEVASRAMSGRVLTDTAIRDIRRTLDHMIRSIEEREA